MRDFVHRFLNLVARRWTQSRCVLSVAPGAKVNFRGMSARPPSRISVGHGSTFEGTMLSDREGSEVSIGNNTFIGNSIIVTAERVEVGDDVLISWGCTLVDHDSHALSWAHRSNDVREFFHGRKDWSHVTVKPVVVRSRAWIGCNAIILKGVTVGEGAVVAAGSVVTRDVPDYTLVAGNPARIVRSVRDEA